MANEIKKYLDNAGMEILVDQIQLADEKVLDAVKKYTDDSVALCDVAGAAASAESAAKAYADEKVTALADGQVKANKEAIETLNGTGAGSVAKAVADAKALIDADIDAVEVLVGNNKTAIDAINNTETGILKQAKDYADGKAAEVQGSVDDLAEFVGELPTDAGVDTVVEYIDKKTAGIAMDSDLSDLRGVVEQLGKDIDAVEADYLKAADKTALQEAIDAVAGDLAAEVERATGVEGGLETRLKTVEDNFLKPVDKVELHNLIGANTEAIAANVKAIEANGELISANANAIAAEQERAEGVEAGIVERLVEVETFFKTAEGETLDTALDTLVEIQKYLDGEGEVADQMILDIAANKKAIEDHVAVDHDFAGADEALKEELMGEINKKADSSVVEGIGGRVGTLETEMDAVEGRATSLESRMTTVEGAVATKAEAKDLTDAVAALEGVDAGLAGRIEALEDKFGGEEGTVEDLISNAKQEAIDAAAEDATTKAGNAETAAKGYADSLNTAMNTRVEALEAIDHDHSNKAELDLIVSGDKAKWDEAAGKAHEHANKGVIDGITADKVAAWDAAEGNAKTYADGLNTTMQGVVDGIGGRVGTLESTITTKADASALTSAVERIAQNETDIAGLKSSVASFVPFTKEEIEAMFA